MECQGAKEGIEEFHQRQARTTIPARSISYGIDNRPTYQKIPENPPYLACGGALKPFQLTGLNWLAYVWSKGENGILADEVSVSSLHRFNGRKDADEAVPSTCRWVLVKPSNPSLSSHISSTSNTSMALSLLLSLYRPSPLGKPSSKGGRPN